MNSYEAKSAVFEAPDGAVQALRAQLDAARERERELIELLGSESPESILHDVRNLVNEVQLLRLLAAQDEV